MKDFQLRFITNKETIRWLKILNAFERSANQSTKELALLTASSSRTIVADITEIRERFAGTFYIEATPFGYNTFKPNAVAYLERKRALLTDEPLFKMIEGIFYHEIKSLGEWSEQLHISESSLIRYVKNCQKVLTPYAVSLSVNPVDLIGDEAAIRCFFHDFYYESEITPHTIQPSVAVQQVAFTLKKEHFFSTYPSISLGDFIYTVYITIERYMNGSQISMNSHYLQRMCAQASFRSFETINRTIEEKIGVKLPETELLFLYVLMMSRRSLIDEAGEALFVAENQPNESITEAAALFLTEIEPNSPNKTRDSLFIRSFFTTLYMREQLTPAANQTIGDIHDSVAANFPQQLAKYRVFFQEYGKQIIGGKTSYENCAVLMVLYIDSLKELYWEQFRTIAFLLEGNAIVCQNIQATAMRYLGRFQTLYFPNALELDHAYIKENKIDLVVTNYSEYMDDLLVGQPAILFQAIPDANDWNRLLQEINVRIREKFLLMNTSRTDR